MAPLTPRPFGPGFSSHSALLPHELLKTTQVDRESIPRRTSWFANETQRFPIDKRFHRFLDPAIVAAT